MGELLDWSRVPQQVQPQIGFALDYATRVQYGGRNMS